MPSRARQLIIKLTTGIESPEKLPQAFTVAATAVASGARVRPLAHRGVHVAGCARTHRGVVAATCGRPGRPAPCGDRRWCPDGVQPVRGTSGPHWNRSAIGSGDPGCCRLCREVLADGAQALVYW